MTFLHNRTAKYIDVKGGLSLVLAPQIDRTKSSVYSDGIKLLVHETDVFASETSFEKMISHKTETLMRLMTVTTTCSDEVKELSVADRECLYESERSLRYIKIFHLLQAGEMNYIIYSHAFYLNFQVFQ